MDPYVTILKILLIVVVLLVIIILAYVIKLLALLKRKLLVLIKAVTYINDIAEPVKHTLKKPQAQLLLNVLALAYSLKRKED